MRLWKRFCDKVLFSNITPLVKLGFQRPLQAEDIPQLPELLDPRRVVIDEQSIDWSSGWKLVKSLHWAARGYLLWPLVFYGGFAAMNLMGPVIVNLFVKRIQSGVHSDADLVEAVVCALAVGFVGLVGGLSIQHYFLGHLRRYQIVTNVLNRKIFTHALNLSKESRERVPVGDIVNHLSTDTDAVAEIGNAVSDMLYCSVMISGACGLLYYYLGSSAWVAIVLLGLLFPLTRKVAREFTRYDETLMKWRDRRVTLMSQILSAIRLVKYFVWEKSVHEEVRRVRAEELFARRRIARAELMVTLLYVSVGTFVLFAVLATFTWRGGHLDAALIFTCVSLFSLLEDPFAFVSRSVSLFITGQVGAHRISEFLQRPAVGAEKTTLATTTEGSAVGFTMEDLCVYLGENRHRALDRISLTVPPGTSLAIVGSVGSGKSSFIHALLGEVEREGRLCFTAVDGREIGTVRMGYVPQEAFILNGTVRENLTFGRDDVQEDEIQRALEVSALALDLGGMAGGLDAEIGEKGINLSGGQRQRLSLARAVLRRPQLVILDDPLSAVDPGTENHLVRELLFGEWRGVTRVMITHRLMHLRHFDQIAFLDQGRLVGVGRFDELRDTSPEFRSYLDEYGRAHVSTGPEDDHRAKVAKPSAEALRVTVEEDREYGAVSGGMYWDYIRALGGEDRFWRPFLLTALFSAAAAGTALPLMQKAWLAYVANVNGGSEFGPAWLRAWALAPLSSIYVYGALGLVVMAGLLTADLFWLRRGLAAGRNLHDRMLKSVMGANIRFFDSTPVGRVLQRFSRDMESVDIQLQWSFEHSMKCFAQVLVTLMLIVASLPIVVVPLLPILWIYYRMQALYRASAREAKRLDSISRSPRYAHFKETLTGLVVIRAFDQREWFISEFYRRLHHHQRMFFGHYMINRWFSSRIPIVGGLVTMATSLTIVWSLRMGQISPGLAGLLTVYSLSFWGILNWGIRIWSEVEARMTSLERIKFYSRLPQERETTVAISSLPEVWPSAGEVCFENVHARYAEHMPLVLKGLSFKVRAGSKVGIIGRTGSGKSTIFQALYRFVEVSDGRILIDGVDIRSIPLPRLRRALAIIPQDPTLFMGSLRSNLDRYSEHSDGELWRVLERTSLAEFVRALPDQLNTELVENGVNLSQGQRQLLCLARALLMRAKVIILDEATASVDVQTDAVVQRVLRESCQDVTMLIIAHRLGTVRDCDQILEIRHGRCESQQYSLAQSNRKVAMETEAF